MKNKKEFFGVLISVLLCVFLVVLAVYATTTISEDITIGNGGGMRIGTGSNADNFTALDDDSLFIEGMLEVDGAAWFDSNVSVSSDFEVVGYASISGNFDTFGTFTANTAASHSFTGDLAVGDDLAVTGGLAITGKLTATGNIDGGSDGSLILNDTLNQDIEFFANVVGNPLFKIWGDYEDDSPVWASMGVDSDGYFSLNAQRQIHFDQVAYFNSDTTQYEDVSMIWADATDHMLIDQNSTTGTENQALVQIDDFRQGATVDEWTEATLYINAVEGWGLAVKRTAEFRGDTIQIEDIFWTWDSAADKAEITQTNVTGTSNQGLITIEDARTGANADSSSEATLIINPSGDYALFVAAGTSYFSGDIYAKEDLTFYWTNTADKASITQTSVTGTEDVPLINIDDARTGATADEVGEASLVIDAAGAYALYVANGAVQFDGTASVSANVDLGDSVTNDIVTVDAVLRIGEVAIGSLPGCTSALDNGLIYVSDSDDCANGSGDGALCICDGDATTWDLVTNN